MAWRPHGRARVDAKNPRAFALCDRCGILHNHVDLRWQYDWRGNSIQNIRLLVCCECYDKPYEGWRPLKLPPDPLPIKNPRPLQNQLAENAQNPSPTPNDLLYGTDE